MSTLYKCLVDLARMIQLFFSKIFVFGCLILGFSNAGLANDKPTLVFESHARMPVERYVEAVLEKAYSDLGYSLTYVQLPLARSYQEANSGTIDGLKGRTAGVSEQYPNLIKVPFTLLEFKVVLVLDTQQCGECKLESLRRVATVRGFKALNNYLQDNPVPFPIEEFTSRERVITMLNSKRIEAAILAKSMIPNNEFEMHKHWEVVELTQASLFHYLHKKHQSLLSPLVIKLQELEKSGKLLEIKRESGFTVE